jgi:Fe-S oxidoreductase
LNPGAVYRAPLTLDEYLNAPVVAEALVRLDCVPVVSDAPRRVLDQIGADLVEMPRSREQSFCCGAGGGHAFFDDGKGSKINGIRVGEAAATGATMLSTGCPFCLTMLEDGLRGVPSEDTTLRVRDFVELVADSLVEDDGSVLP